MRYFLPRWSIRHQLVGFVSAAAYLGLIIWAWPLNTYRGGGPHMVAGWPVPFHMWSSEAVTLMSLHANREAVGEPRLAATPVNLIRSSAPS
jgi:hypothetical protein